MKELSEKLSRTVEFAEPILAKIAEAESRKPALKGGWSRKQVIGHLIDSASKITSDSSARHCEAHWNFPATTRTAVFACRPFRTHPGRCSSRSGKITICISPTSLPICRRPNSRRNVESATTSPSHCNSLPRII